jgi:hypothetical protein
MLPRNASAAVAIVGLLILAAADASAQILSSKRGFGDVGANYSNLQATGAGWYYTWGTGVANPGAFDANHVPMIWSGTPSQSTINNIKSRPGVEWLLGFNEPERPDQANMSVGQAISSWTTISNGFSGTNIKLVSPAVADTGDGQAWLSSFMSQAAANSLRVDAVAFHWYGVSTPDNPAGAASSFLSRVASYHNQYQKPVFITEFAIHDWGGNYSDAQIIEANRQFLDIVIPELESRSYVAGYSWYHWFSDAHLYEGNPPKPTPMAYSYVGAVTSGETANIGGQNLGEHVAYLAGGQLTMTGSPGTVRYINALEGVSRITGGVDWSLSGTNWVRIQPGATLAKTGSNQITFAGGTITNNGALEVNQGTLRVGSPITGNGAVRIKGGTLAVIPAGRFVTAPLIEVRGAGTLDVSSLASPYLLAAGQTLKNDGVVMGNITARSGSTIEGAGHFTGNVRALTDTTVRVGNNGAGVASRHIIDDFESYALGDVRTTASPPWTAHQNTSLADIENIGGTRALSYGWASDFRGASRTIPDATILGEGDAATYFFRINSKTDDPDHNVGLGDQANTDGVNFGDYEAQLRVKQGAAPGTFAIDARNGGVFSPTLTGGLALNAWYNIWMVVDQGSDTYDVYMNTGVNGATASNKLNASPLAFRNGTSDPLDSFLALAGSAPVDNGLRIDSVVYQNGVDLSNPLAGFDPGLVWSPATLTVSGDFSLDVGATLELNLASPDHHDVLSVSGLATIGGTLSVSLAFDAQQPQAGDVFDILDFGSASGGFSAFSLPSLPSGLAWKTANLLTSGALEVITAIPGDFNQDGIVDGEDLLTWQAEFATGQGGDADGDGDGDGNDFLLWQHNVSAAGSSTASAIVPEPSIASLMLVCCAAPMLVARYRAAASAACLC